MLSPRSLLGLARITVPLSVRVLAGGGSSSAVRIAFTPGTASAWLTSRCLTRACGNGLSSSLQNSMPSA
jgi:hypothetical protein